MGWRMKLDVFLQGVSPNAIGFYKGLIKRKFRGFVCSSKETSERGKCSTPVTYAVVNEHVHWSEVQMTLLIASWWQEQVSKEKMVNDSVIILVLNNAGHYLSMHKKDFRNMLYSTRPIKVIGQSLVIFSCRFRNVCPKSTKSKYF